MELEQHIQRIEEKTHLLLKKLQQVQSDNELLHAEIDAKEQELSLAQKAIGNLEDKLKLARIASVTQGAPSAEDEEFKKEIRRKINDYIAEIDRCIAMLNS
ncbi:hypothetical protein MKQ68_18425 [Chitinophaga horti]|uniref:Uncharacterized protein n=1 Tax=Chitinophaga horti TaxID=2920382 RepID=A0ABY6J124_9BACT|nr:hypothetical protein [Chitinophaga horti]UYQ92066.1 hypothetical protein MKQ68_18425 [Chitinophaga horti]